MATTLLEEIEHLLTLAEAARMMNVHVSTIWRWVLRGCRGVKMHSIVVGGRRLVSIEAIEQFVRETTAAANGEPVPVRTAKQRQRDIDRAKRELAAEGITT